MIQEWEKIIDPNFISAEEIGPVGSEIVGTITDIDYKECYDTQTRQKIEKQALCFKECKPLILNKTNAKQLRKLFDPQNEDPGKCVGQKVTLYVTTTKVAGKTCDCIRLKQYIGTKCQGCGGQIKPTATMDENKIIRYSKAHCGGKILCMDCMKKLAKERNEKA